MWQTKHAAFVCLKLVCVTNEQSATWEQHHRFMRRYLTIQMKHSARHSVNRTFFNTCCCWIISRKHQACYPMICLYFIFLTHSNNAKRKTGCVNRIAVQSIFTLKFLTQPSLPWINRLTRYEVPLHIEFFPVQGEPSLPRDWEAGCADRKKKDKQDSPITVSDYELYMGCSFNAVYSLPHFVTIKYSQQHLCRPLLITHHNNKRSQPEIAIANLH